MFSRSPKFQRLSELIHLSKNTEQLDDLPEKLETIVESFNSSGIHPQFRTDIFDVLNAAAEISTLLARPTYNARTAVSTTTKLLAILGRILVHLETERPAFSGFGILLASTKSLYPATYTTEEEAYKVLDQLQRMGTAQHCEVIPIKITSDLALRPTLPSISTTLQIEDGGASDFELETDQSSSSNPPIPTGVLPADRPAVFGGPVGDAFVKQFNEARKQAEKEQP